MDKVISGALEKKLPTNGKALSLREERIIGSRLRQYSVAGIPMT